LWLAALLWIVTTIQWSMRIPDPLAILGALLLAALSIGEIVRRYNRHEDLGILLVLAAFVFIYPLSGVFQFIGGSLDRRGFFDYRFLDPAVQSHYCYATLLLIFAAYLALVAGVGKGTSKQSENPHLSVNRKRLVVFGATVLALGLLGTVRLFQYSGLPDLVSFLITMDRGRYVGDGFGRYVFLSQWVPWGVTFISIAILSGPWGLSRLKSSLVLVGSLVIIVVNSYWSGGRATILFGIVPMLMCLTRLRKSSGAGILPYFLAIVTAVMIAMTSARSEFSPQISEDIVNIVDWHAGRFCMVGLGFALTANSGAGFGTTILGSFFSSINDLMTLAHLPFQLPHVQGMESIIGGYLINDPDNNSILPGSICELYYDFGVLGVVVGHFLIGRLARICSNAVHRGANVGSVLLGAYCLLSLSISTLSGNISSAFYYLLYIGLPLLVMYWWDASHLPSSQVGASIQGQAAIRQFSPLGDSEIRIV